MQPHRLDICEGSVEPVFCTLAVNSPPTSEMRAGSWLFPSIQALRQFHRLLGLSGSALAATAPGEPAGVSRCMTCPGTAGNDARCVRKPQAIEQPPAVTEYDGPAIQTEGAPSLAARHWSLRHVAPGQPGRGVRIGPAVQWRETLSETKPGKYRFMRIDRPAGFGVKRATSLPKLLKRPEKLQAFF